MTVPVTNGAFFAPTLKSARGRVRAQFSAGSGATLSKVFTKDRSRYYVLMPTGTQLSTPSVPNGVFTSLSSPTSATLTWHAPTSDGGSPVTAYLVARDAGTAGAHALSKTVPATDLSRTFLHLTTGATYRLSVSAINGQGNGPAASATVLVAGPPRAPAIRRAKAGAAGGAITATAAWGPPGSDGGSPITGYRVRALRLSSRGSVLSATTSAVLPTAARKLSMRLPKRGKYRFTAQARNAVGAGPQSRRSNLVAGR